MKKFIEYTASLLGIIVVIVGMMWGIISYCNDNFVRKDIFQIIYDKLNSIEQKLDRHIEK